ncbi:MAG: DUF5610 domain-containing protein [Cellvibrionaceae bacterium]
MLSPLPSAPESGRHQLTNNYSESYSSSKESSSSQTERRADGTTVTKLEYSSQRSSYTVSLNNSTGVDKPLTYTSLNQSYQFSSVSFNSRTSVSSAPAPVTDPVTAPVTTETSSGSSETLSLSSSSAVQDESPLLDGANNILKFIEQRIAKEKAGGASEIELAELWEQGLKGFAQGYNEARDILDGSGQLSEEVSASIETLYDQVRSGFDKIYDQYISDKGDDNASAPVVDTPDVATPAPIFSNSGNGGNAGGPRQFISSGLLNNGGSQLNEQFQAIGSNGGISSNSAIADLVDSLGDNVDAAVEYGRKDTFTFQLQTLDGDTISINASNTAIFVGDYSSANGSEIEGMKDKSNFSMDIVGELDEQERVAIEDLLNQVMSLADEFYNGDINKAYEAAMEIGYDQNEIASYSINLRQTEQFSVAAAYQDLQPSVSPDAKEAFASIGDFAQSVLETLYKPENYAFFDYTQLLKGISEQIDQQIAPSDSPSFKDAVEQLVDTAAQNQLGTPTPALDTTAEV